MILLSLLLLRFPMLASEARFGLFVGSEKGGEGTAPLHYSYSDAERMRRVFIELGGTAEERALLVRGNRVKTVLESLQKIKKMVVSAKASGESTFFVFYYSGHASEEGFRIGGETLPFDIFKKEMEALGADVRIAFIDACRSGSATRIKGGRPERSFLTRGDGTKGATGQVFITSSAPDEDSQESDEITGSFFTHYLISGLRGAADNEGDGEVSLEESYRYAYNHTILRTWESARGPQHPVYDYDLSGKGGVVLTRIGQRKSHILFPSGMEGPLIIFDQKKKLLVAEIEGRPDREVKIALSPGRYLVQKRERDHLLVSRVSLAPDEGKAIRLQEMEKKRLKEDVTKGIERRWQEKVRTSLAFKVGFQSFFDAPVREALIPPTPLLGGEVEMENLLRRQISMKFDAAMGGGSYVLEFDPYDVPISFTEYTAGVSFAYSMRAGPGRFFVGPRLSAIYVKREFQEPLAQPFQDMITMSPGLIGGAGITMGKRFAFLVEGRVNYLYYYYGEDQSLGFSEVFMNLRYDL